MQAMVLLHVLLKNPVKFPQQSSQPRHLGKGHIISTTFSFLMVEDHLQTVAEG